MDTTENQECLGKTFSKNENKTKVLNAEIKISSYNIKDMESDPQFKHLLYDGKHWGHKWYKKNKNYPDSKPIHIMGKYIKPPYIIAHSNYKGKRMWAVMKKTKFIKLLEKNRCIFETLYENYPRRLYIDIDGHNEHCLIETKKILRKVYGMNVRMSISGSHGIKHKKPFWSYHIICPDIIFKDLQEMKDSKFISWMEAEKNDINGIDLVVYKRFQEMKQFNQGKSKSNRYQTIIENTNEEEHIIQVFNKKPTAEKYADEYLHYIKFEIKKINLSNHKQGKKCGIKTFTLKHIKQLHWNIPKPDIDFELDDAFKILKAIPNPTGQQKLGRHIMFCVMNWFAGEGGTFEQFQQWEQPHLRTTPQSEDGWNKAIPVKGETRRRWGRLKIQHLLEQFYGNIPNKRFAIFKKQFIKEKDADTLVCQKFIEDKHINSKKYQLMKLGMGAGKTYRVIEWLIKEKQKNPNIRICWITNRITMALNLMGRLNGNNDKNLNYKKEKYTIDTPFGKKEIERKVKVKGRDLEFQNYKTIGQETGLTGMARANYRRNQIQSNINCLVIELESIHLCSGTKWNNKNAQYDIMIVDEIESVFNAFRSDTTHNDNYQKNYETFERLMKDSNKVFLMDAYLHYRTIRYIKALEPSKEKNLICREKKFDLINKTINTHQGFYTWYNYIKDDINKGKKLYIFYPFKTGRGSTMKLSIDEFKQRLLNNTHLEFDDILIYNGDKNKEKKKLINCSEVWKEARVIITNSCITVGVNYEYDDFDKVYLSYDDLLNPRDVIQSSFRIRKTKEQIIEFYKFPNLSKIICKSSGQLYEPNPIKIPNIKYEATTKAFIIMRDFLLEEYNAKSMNTLKLYFDETGYKMNKLWIIDNNDAFDFKNYDKLKDGLGIWDWLNIDKISKREMEKKEGKIFSNTSTIDDTLQVRKFYNDSQFGIPPIIANDIFLDMDWDGANIIKQEYYNKPQLRDGMQKLIRNKGDDIILNYALKYNKLYSINAQDIIKYDENYGKVEEHFTYNNKKLTPEDKLKISEYMHIPRLCSIGKTHRNKFLKQSDYVIKKQLIILFFGRNIMKDRSKWTNRNIGEFNLTEMLEHYLNFNKNIVKYKDYKRNMVLKSIRNYTKVDYKLIEFLDD